MTTDLIFGKLKAVSFFSFYASYIRLAYPGNDLECPICGYKGNKFLTFGVVPRENVMCPSCFSLERHRLQWLYFKKKTNLFSKKLALLHFAPEKSFSEKIRSLNNISYVSCDLEKYDKTVMIEVDITDIPFKGNSFDVILCNHVLEHILNDTRAMKEMYRVLKKGGWSIFQTPIDYTRKVTYEDPTIVTEAARLKAYNQFDHVRIYGRDYKKRLAKAGFKVKEDDFVKSLPTSVIKKFALDKNELLYFCQK